MLGGLLYARLYKETIWPNNQLVIARDLAISCLLPVPNTTHITGDIRSKLCETSTDKIAEGFLAELLATKRKEWRFPRHSSLAIADKVDYKD